MLASQQNSTVDRPGSTLMHAAAGIENLGKNTATRAVDMSAQIFKGEIFRAGGVLGIGKTTLLRMLAVRDKSTGTVLIDGSR